SSVIMDSKDLTLSQLFLNYPNEILGKDSGRFGNQLPFLFKILSAESPLSIQAHPDKIQAEAGFLDENSRSVPMDAFNRNYKDNNHKPEIICALTPFTAMCGFRDLDAIEKNFLKIQSSVLNVKTGIRSFFESLMSLESSKLKKLVENALDWAENDNSLEAVLIKKFAALYDNDPGVLAPLFLNVYVLNPGEALYQGAGELHAYVEGTGIELMSVSDNVLRGGLTPKHVDVDELLKVLNFRSADKGLLYGIEKDPGVFEHETPSDEFFLKCLKVEEKISVEIKNRKSIEILICISGNAVLYSKEGTITISRGESLLIPASVVSYTLEGVAEIFTAGIPGQDKK
ncbi:MAG: mannose-6-phosphate isomerase, class I, partial [Spirochaetales bacterium]|nr:mannose-6-phosphate isomerase, class I [Spirochaetales bacterium]